MDGCSRLAVKSAPCLLHCLTEAWYRWDSLQLWECCECPAAVVESGEVHPQGPDNNRPAGKAPIEKVALHREAPRLLPLMGASIKVAKRVDAGNWLTAIGQACHTARGA
jgi:hypothetical protein